MHPRGNIYWLDLLQSPHGYRTPKLQKWRLNTSLSTLQTLHGSSFTLNELTPISIKFMEREILFCLKSYV